MPDAGPPCQMTAVRQRSRIILRVELLRGRSRPSLDAAYHPHSLRHVRFRQPEVRYVRPVQMPVHRRFGGAVASRLPRFHPRRSRITSTPGPIGASCGGPRRRAGCRLASPTSWLAPSASHRLVCFQHCWLSHRDAGPAVRATIPSCPMVQPRPRGPKARSGGRRPAARVHLVPPGHRGEDGIDAVCSDSVYCLPNTGSLAGMSRINASSTHASASLPNTQGHRCIPPNS